MLHSQIILFTSAAGPKVGICPAATVVVTCFQTRNCAQDGDCPGAQKCCTNNGCNNRVCINPQTTGTLKLLKDLCSTKFIFDLKFCWAL